MAQGYGLRWMTTYKGAGVKSKVMANVLITRYKLVKKKGLLWENGERGGGGEGEGEGEGNVGKMENRMIQI